MRCVTFQPEEGDNAEDARRQIEEGGQQTDEEVGTVGGFLLKRGAHRGLSTW